MRKILEASGWFMFGSCRCNGIYKEKFRLKNGDQTIMFKVAPNRNTWEFLRGKRKFDSGVGIESLKVKLEQL